MHTKKIVAAGIPIDQVSRVLIMLHGRGANAEDILGISNYLDVKDFSLLAPQATNNTWYPYSFLAPTSQNEPWLSSAINLLKEITGELEGRKISTENIYFLGFSQGACLALEYVARNANKYGGIVAFTGGLIGDKINESNYSGDFKNTGVFIGSSDPDPHVPVHRVNDTATQLEKMGAQVTKKIYPNMGHTINQDEIDEANRLIFRSKK